MSDDNEWELFNFSTYRLKVPGGWLVNVTSERGEAVYFFPDPEYKWEMK